MNVTVVGHGLIGGSFEKAALRAGHAVKISGRGAEPDVSAADIVLVAIPPAAVVGVVDALVPRLPKGAVVVDATGVKATVCAALSKYAAAKDFTFVGGHPMAGKERSGYANSCADLFDGASMILTPFATCPAAVLERLETFFRGLGFARVVRTDPAHHDEMIAFTSQLCHLISSAYVRDPLAPGHVGYSAGSFRDMARVGAPDPDTWTQLFFDNRAALLPVLERYVARLDDFREALAANDRARMHRALEEGVTAKAAFGKGLA